MGRPHHLVARLHVGPVRYVPFMPVPFRVDELTFNDGSVVQTGDADIVVVLGPNNSGKSRTLQETNQHLALNPGQVMAPQEFVVVPALRVARELDEEGVSQWLREHRYTWTEPSNLVENFRTAQGASNSFTDVPHHWLAPDRIGFLAQHLVRALWCGERLGYLASPQKLNPGVHPEHAIHWLVRSPALMQAFRDSFKDAFGMNVIVDAWGNNIFLRVSEQESQEDFSTTSADGFADEELFERLGRLQTIDAQSDGVRSFSGIVLTLLAGQYPLVLLDEPAAGAVAWKVFGYAATGWSALRGHPQLGHLAGLDQCRSRSGEDHPPHPSGRSNDASRPRTKPTRDPLERPPASVLAGARRSISRWSCCV